MKATISADIVSSTSLKSDDLRNLRVCLKSLIDYWETNQTGFWGRIVKGDSIECVIPDVNESLKIALLLKLETKIFASTVECSKETQSRGLRFAIGAGTLKAESKADDIIDGPAIYLSGRKMQKAAGATDESTIFQIEQGYDVNGVSTLVSGMVTLLDKKIDGYTAKQCEVVYWKLRGLKEDEIAEKLHISQPTVNRRSTSAEWKSVENAINAFESFNFIC